MDRTEKVPVLGELVFRTRRLAQNRQRKIKIIPGGHTGLREEAEAGSATGAP